MARKDSGGARLLDGAFSTLPEGNVWWTDSHLLTSRRPTIFALDPQVPESRNFSYAINDAPSPVGAPDVKPTRAARTPDDVTPVASNGDFRDSPWVPDNDLPRKDSLLEDDAADFPGFHVPPPARSGDRGAQGSRRKRQWRRHFDMDDEWLRSWKDYRLHSTIHGVRHAAEPQPFCLRRLLWTLLLLVLAAIFLYLTVLAIRVFYTWPVVVHVRTAFATSARFPAITICNQNSFRVTRAMNQGLYDLLYDMYGPEGAGHYINLNNYNATSTSMRDLFLATTHTKEDLIMQCTWDGIPCDESDFVLLLTDFGVCYTFNSGLESNGLIRYATHTGAGSGLNVLLNIEQYEYMPGPNQGAGLKLLVHNQNEVPLVKDNGIVLPRGSHSFLGLRHISTEQLTPPYGECESDRPLQYYGAYSRTNCMENCKQKYLELFCGCRDYYMPADTLLTHNSMHRVCTLLDYQVCLLDAKERVDLNGNMICDCPIPCVQESYEVETSFAAVSNFEVLNLLYSSRKVELQMKFDDARNVTDSVTVITDEDTELITNFINAVNAIETALMTLLANMDEAEAELDSMVSEIDARTGIHDNGYNLLSGYVDNAFMKGWRIYKERALDQVTSNFYQVGDQFQLVVQQLKEDLADAVKVTLWLIMENELLGRQEISAIAKTYIDECYQAFLNGDPIVSTYTATRMGHFDEAFTDVDLLRKHQLGQEDGDSPLYTGLLDQLQLLTTAVEQFLQMGEDFLTKGKKGQPTDAEMQAVYNDYVTAARAYIAALVGFESGIVMKPLEELQRRIDLFHVDNRTLVVEVGDVGISMNNIRNLINGFNSTIWIEILREAANSESYLTHSTILKGELADAIASGSLQDKLGNLDLFFTALRSRGRDLTDRWYQLRLAWGQLWRNMLTDTSLSAFYTIIQEQYTGFARTIDNGNADMHLLYARRLSDVLDETQEEIEATPVEQIVYMVNADFPGLDIDEKLNEIDATFKGLDELTNVMTIIGDIDKNFKNALSAFQEAMIEVKEGNSMDFRFYVDNTMRLDIYMKDLNREEIIHVPAYDIVNLLGDIGGLLGLFLGASILSVIELIDLVVHHLFKWIMSRNPRR